jgi:DNA/RNA endonuclease YhcR with UshA esterase domain
MSALLLSFAACTTGNGAGTTEAPGTTAGTPDETTGEPKPVGVMTHAEYIGAQLDTEVCIEAYVQATQSWWEKDGQGKITAYLQDRDGAYFAYEMNCSAEDAARLTPGTKIRVTGFKSEWSGEIEITDCSFTFVEGADTYVAQPVDLTGLLGTEDLIKYQNQAASFKGMTVVSIEYKNDAPGDDIYVTLSKNDSNYSFCVERYLTGPETEVYQAVGALKAGDVIDVDCFLYWYEAMNPHITAVKASENVSGEVKPEGVMTHAEYIAAELESEVVIEAYVQATQSWWDNKITVYLQDRDGAYFAYEMACTEEDAKKLTPGTKIRVSGYKAEWSGEVEIVDCTFTFVEGGDTFVAEAFDVTDFLGSDELIKHQNEFVRFSSMTVVSVEYKNGTPGDDIYVTLSKNETNYSFCIEVYLTGTTTEVYQAVGALKAGDIIDVEGFLYWYEGVNTHITAVKAAQ